MIPEGIDYLIQELAEDLEEEVQSRCDEFWSAMDDAGITQEERNEVTKKLLNGVEYLFTYSPK